MGFQYLYSVYMLAGIFHIFHVSRHVLHEYEQTQAILFHVDKTRSI